MAMSNRRGVRGAHESGTHASGVLFTSPFAARRRRAYQHKTAGLLRPGGFRLPKNAVNRLAIRVFELASAAEAFLSLRSRPALETATEQVQYD